MNGLREYVQQKLGELPSAEHRAIAALMSIPTRVQSMMTEAELEAIIKSVADAIRSAEATKH